MNIFKKIKAKKNANLTLLERYNKGYYTYENVMYECAQRFLYSYCHFYYAIESEKEYFEVMKDCRKDAQESINKIKRGEPICELERQNIIFSLKEESFRIESNFSSYVKYLLTDLTYIDLIKTIYDREYNEAISSQEALSILTQFIIENDIADNIIKELEILHKHELAPSSIQLQKLLKENQDIDYKDIPSPYNHFIGFNKDLFNKYLHRVSICEFSRNRYINQHHKDIDIDFLFTNKCPYDCFNSHYYLIDEEGKLMQPDYIKEHLFPINTFGIDFTRARY